MCSTVFSKRHKNTPLQSPGAFSLCTLQDQFQPPHHCQTLIFASTLWGYEAWWHALLGLSLCPTIRKVSTNRKQTQFCDVHIFLLLKVLCYLFYKFGTLLLHLFHLVLSGWEWERYPISCLSWTEEETAYIINFLILFRNCFFFFLEMLYEFAFFIVYNLVFKNSLEFL